MEMESCFTFTVSFKLVKRYSRNRAKLSSALLPERLSLAEVVEEEKKMLDSFDAPPLPNFYYK